MRPGTSRLVFGANSHVPPSCTTNSLSASLPAPLSSATLLAGAGGAIASNSTTNSFNGSGSGSSNSNSSNSRSSGVSAATNGGGIPIGDYNSQFDSDAALAKAIAESMNAAASGTGCSSGNSAGGDEGIQVRAPDASTRERLIDDSQFAPDEGWGIPGIDFGGMGGVGPLSSLLDDLHMGNIQDTLNRLQMSMAESARAGGGGRADPDDVLHVIEATRTATQMRLQRLRQQRRDLGIAGAGVSGAGVGTATDGVGASSEDLAYRLAMQEYASNSNVAESVPLDMPGYGHRSRGAGRGSSRSTGGGRGRGSQDGRRGCGADGGNIGSGVVGSTFTVGANGAVSRSRSADATAGPSSAVGAVGRGAES